VEVQKPQGLFDMNPFAQIKHSAIKVNSQPDPFTQPSHSAPQIPDKNQLIMELLEASFRNIPQPQDQEV
jgi:hypothetical protein